MLADPPSDQGTGSRGGRAVVDNPGPSCLRFVALIPKPIVKKMIPVPALSGGSLPFILAVGLISSGGIPKAISFSA